VTFPSRSRLPADSMPRYRLATPRLRSLSCAKTLSSHQEKRDCDYLGLGATIRAVRVHQRLGLAPRIALMSSHRRY